MARLPRTLVVVLALVAVVVLAASASAMGTGANVIGKGRLVYTPDGEATVFGTDLRPGARITISGRATLTPTCVVLPRRKPCFKVDPRTGATVVLRPIRFLIEGTAFRVVLVSNASFAVGLSGAGKLALDGRGTYTVDGVARPYRGRRTLHLAS